MTTVLRVAESGFSTMVQDLGRYGSQRKGVAVSGALDAESLELANRIVGNPAGTGALEVSYRGPTLVAEAGPLRMAIVGARARLERHAGAAAVATPLQPNESFVLQPGEALKIGTLKDASVLYVAIEGGLDLPMVLGSAATDARGGFGGWQGRTLLAGDRLPLHLAAPTDRPEWRLDRPLPDDRSDIHVLLGPQADYFAAAEIDRFLSTTFTVSPAANRMGMRLDGARLAHARGFNITSDAVTFGSIQIMGNGQPLILMADRPTTGGYPKIATINSYHLSRIGRLPIGATVRFRQVSITEAHALRQEKVRALQSCISTIHELKQGKNINLLEYNLISGVHDARS